MATFKTEASALKTNGSAVYHDPTQSGSAIRVRRFPYPFRSMLAICSDLDETPDRHVYWETARFLNTHEPTTMGAGVGLEVGNTIYFDMPPDQFAYWNTDDTGRAMVRTLIRSGHIDCLHSYGDLATTRTHAAKALDELTRHDCRLNIWIDHGVAPSNFGSDIMKGLGDVPDADVYHADITHSYGIRYVWRGRVTSVIGQDATPSFRGIYDGYHPVDSTKTIMKELLKNVLGRVDQGKYLMHVKNHVFRPVSLRSGHQVNEFLRANPHWGGVSCGETADGFAEVMTDRALARLIKHEGVCILYTHLGKISRRDEPFGPQTRNAFRRLAAAYRAGNVLVATTRRLLDYHYMLRNIEISTIGEETSLRVCVRPLVQEPLNYSGLSFYVSDPTRTEVEIDGRKISPLQHNPPDHTQHVSVSIPWTRLEFPRLSE